MRSWFLAAALAARTVLSSTCLEFTWMSRMMVSVRWRMPFTAAFVVCRGSVTSCMGRQGDPSSPPSTKQSSSSSAASFVLEVLRAAPLSLARVLAVTEVAAAVGDAFFLVPPSPLIMALIVSASGSTSSSSLSSNLDWRRGEVKSVSLPAAATSDRISDPPRFLFRSLMAAHPM
jgi:hypothetical protein